MGNRALVIISDRDGDTCGVGIYLHWNGGPESVYPMLDYLSGKMGRDASYTTARFCQVAGNYLGGALSLGLQPVPGTVEEVREQAARLSHGDNGLYLIRLTADGYVVIGRYVDGEWLGGDTIEAERTAAIQGPRGREMRGHLATLNDPFFNR